MMDHKNLTELFRKLGADDPAGWASSQIDEGINQLGRFVFLKQAWSLVVDENDSSWIDSEIQQADSNPEGPFSGFGRALSKLSELGVHRSVIVDLVRGAEAALLFSFCRLLDDPGVLPDEVSEMSWGLFQTDSVGIPVASIEAIHESVLESDPTGREMRPRELNPHA